MKSVQTMGFGLQNKHRDKDKNVNERVGGGSGEIGDEDQGVYL